MSPRLQNISLEFDPYIPWNRGILRGIEAFARGVPEWRLMRHRMIPGPRVWVKDAERRIDGILSTGEKEWAEKTGIPLVRFGAQEPEPGFPVVEVDYDAVGQLAAQELADKGYRSLAVLDTAEGPEQDIQRVAGFREFAARSCIPVYSASPSFQRVSDLLNDPVAAGVVMESLMQGEKPVGLFARNLAEAYVLHSLVLQSGVSIPDEVGLIVGGNDRDLLEALQPPLTSVSRNSFQIGYAAAEALKGLLDGEDVEPSIVIQPAGIVDRGSTNLQAVGDAVVRRARRLIRERLDQPFHVDPLARELGVSGRSLRRRFQAAMRHSPVREVQLARLEKAKELLGSSRISVLEIAQRCGFAESCQLSTFFKVETGMTPTEFRGQGTLKNQGPSSIRSR
jgi:AraC-like DNA-binding protein